MKDYLDIDGDVEVAEDYQDVMKSEVGRVPSKKRRIGEDVGRDYEIKKFKPLLAAGIAGATAAGVAGEKLAARRRRRGTKAAIRHLRRKGWRLAWVRPRVKRTK